MIKIYRNEIFFKTQLSETGDIKCTLKVNLYRKNSSNTLVRTLTY